MWRSNGSGGEEERGTRLTDRTLEAHDLPRARNGIVSSRQVDEEAVRGVEGSGRETPRGIRQRNAFTQCLPMRIAGSWQCPPPGSR